MSEVMRVLVVAIDNAPDPPQVRLRSEVGEFVAEWRGALSPEIGETFVEVDVPDDLEWGTDVVPEPGADPRLVTAGDETVVTGLIKQVPSEGPVVMTVGPTTVCLDITGRPLPVIVDTTATARVKTVVVNPMNL
jgi:hypothetical protein